MTAVKMGEYIADAELQHELKQLMYNIESNTYLLQGDHQKYAVKLASAHQEIVAEHRAHNKICVALNAWWGYAAKPIACGTPSLGLERIMVPRTMFKIAERDGDPVATQTDRDPFVGFAMEFIRPLHKHHIRALVETFCDLSIKESMLSNFDLENLRLHVRLGEMSPPDEAKSTKLSRPVYFDQLLRAHPGKMVERARQMGAALAIIHCKCRYDGAGVKFQLALHPKKTRVFMWVTDFAHCKPFTICPGTELRLAKALAENPALPKSPYAFKREKSERARAVESVWNAFKDAYVSASYKLLGDMPEFCPKFSPTSVMDYLSCMMAPPGVCKDTRMEKKLEDTW